MGSLNRYACCGAVQYKGRRGKEEVLAMVAKAVVAACSRGERRGGGRRERDAETHGFGCDRRRRGKENPPTRSSREDNAFVAVTKLDTIDISTR